MFHNLVSIVLDTHSSLVFGSAWFGWIYETDRFVGFVGSSWGGGPGCALVLSRGLVSCEASWSPRPGLTFAADPQIRTNWVNPSLQPTQEKLPANFFRQKLALDFFGRYDALG